MDDSRDHGRDDVAREQQQAPQRPDDARVDDLGPHEDEGGQVRGGAAVRPPIAETRD